MDGHKFRSPTPPEPADTGSNGKEVVMTSLPDRPNLDQLRSQAKELKRALAAGEDSALDRLLAAHPKYAGRPAERAEGRTFTLRDAQVTIARELGLDSWKDLLGQLDAPSVRRWDTGAEHELLSRAFRESKSLGHGHVGVEHLLLALLNVPQPTPASATLNDLGLNYDLERERVRKQSRRSRRKYQKLSPAYQILVGWSQGIALGLGAIQLEDEHVLIAFLYGSHDWHSFFVDPDEAFKALQQNGVIVPKTWPPVPASPAGPWGPYVYLAWEDLSIVSRELTKRYPSGTVIWGMNKSKWKRDHWYIHGEDEIPMEDIVRSLFPGDEIEVLTDREGSRLESALAPRRYRHRPNKESL
jgi:Clp amino terminal domain, pathogenicity island component